MLLTKWNRLSNTDKKLFLESGIYALWVPLLSLLPLRFYCNLLGKQGSKPDKAKGDNQEIYAIKVAMLRCAHYFPWTRNCLRQAIIAKLMLNKRNIEATLFLGVAKDADKLKAHAWVVCGDIIITGAKGSNSFSPVEWFT